MPIEDWSRFVDAIRLACDHHSAIFPLWRNEDRDTASFVGDAPATRAELEKVQLAIGASIPRSLEQIFLNYSKAIDIAWQLRKEDQPPAPFDDIFSGQLDLRLNELPDIYAVYRKWVDTCFTDSTDPYDQVWHNKFPFLAASNGDIIAIDADIDGQPVLYLSHDAGEGHGYRMGDNAEDFVDRFLQLGCPGLEDWQWLPFTSDASSGIDPNCDNAVNWCRWFNLARRAA